MKKDKEWLQRQAKQLKIGYECLHDDYYRACDEFIYYINQLEEPEKPVVPQYVADWYEENKDDIEMGLWDVMYNLVNEISQSELEDELEGWFDNLSNNPFQTVVLMHMNGYTVEKEKRFYIRDKVCGATLMMFDLSDGGIEFVDGFSKEETLIFKEKEKAELIAKYVDGTAEEVTE